MCKIAVYNSQKILGRGLLCKSFYYKLRGYTFYRKARHNLLALENEKMIHMFFVFFKLAVLVLDKEKKVMANFIINPWKISSYYKQAKYIIETPDLTMFKAVKPGDVLDLKIECN